jgi:hypothetical protein
MSPNFFISKPDHYFRRNQDFKERKKYQGGGGVERYTICKRICEKNNNYDNILPKFDI